MVIPVHLCFSTDCLFISSWMTAHHLKLNPSKTELLFIPSTTGPHRDLAISLGNSLITPTEDAGSLGVILDGLLSFSAHIANLTRSCRFLLYTIRRIRPFLSQEATQLLVQSLVISRLDYCNSLLAGLPLRAIRPLQLVQNAAARLIFNLHPHFYLLNIWQKQTLLSYCVTVEVDDRLESLISLRHLVSLRRCGDRPAMLSSLAFFDFSLVLLSGI
ncbi:hypothetical protein NFI96_015872 [Prochilodus magdalenae]|nr:hypothetical protein NFI96_015872 [Prochilodus magdalenae]